MTTLASVSLSRYYKFQEHRAHMVGPRMRTPCLSWFGFGCHVHCTICDSDARRSPRAEDPGSPHAEIEPPFVYKASTHTFVSQKGTKH